jgi:CheY-like chemotaxis protein
MSPTPRQRILVVDDEISVRTTVSLLLTAEGYDVGTAENGFDALLQLRDGSPALIVSDLNMPQMSGFEFLSVIRRRFPEVLVVAMSGAYSSGDAIPGGVIADAFYAKGGGASDPGALLRIVADLLQASASRQTAHRSKAAPVWIPRNGKDSTGSPYVVLTCTECLRSFPLRVSEAVNPEVVETPCIFCLSTVRYIIDFSLSVASPAKPSMAKHMSDV